MSDRGTILIIGSRHEGNLWVHLIEHTNPLNILDVHYDGMVVFDKEVSIHELVSKHLVFQPKPSKEWYTLYITDDINFDPTIGTPTYWQPELPEIKTDTMTSFVDLGTIERKGKLHRILVMELDQMSCHLIDRHSRVVNCTEPDQVFCLEEDAVKDYLLNHWRMSF